MPFARRPVRPPTPLARAARAELGATLAWVLALVASLLVVPLGPDLRAAEELVDGIAAQVGSNTVLISEVLQMTAPLEANVREQGGKDQDIARLRLEGLERMIEWRLIEQLVRQAELYAEDAEVDRAIDAIAQDNEISRDELEASVASAGISPADYRDQIKREIERSKVMGLMVSSKVKVDQADVAALYAERFSGQPVDGDRIHLRQLFVMFGEKAGMTRDEACGYVEEARQRVLAGEPFENVARQHNAIVPQRGGDIGWVHTSSIAGWMKGIVAKLEPGGLSEVTELPVGCNLLQLVDRRAHEFITLEMASPELSAELFAIREGELYREWLNELRETTFIERREHFSKAARIGGDSGYGAASAKEGESSP
ncbi:MAG: SurA N-terminal domain-containing protein [Myxococcales bacterium]|nr:SurA N-terminal domain-containing protein [Myxococcales bacterium]